MRSNDKTFLFEGMPIPRAVFSMTVPAMLTALVSVLYNLADTYYVGILNDPRQTAAVTLAGPVLLAFYAVTNLFGTGTSSVMGRALGRKDMDTVQRSSAFGFWAAVVSGFVYSLLYTLFSQPLMVVLGVTDENRTFAAEYLFWTTTLGALPAILNIVMAFLVRTEGAAFHASIGTMSGCILNIILDPIFVLPWGLNMGAAGAGCATFVSNCFACVYFFVLLHVRRKETIVCIRPRMAKPKARIVKDICAVGIPASIQNLLNVTSATVLNSFTAAFGSDAVAAMGIVKRIDNVPWQISFGVTQGIMPLVSYNYGSKNYARAKKAIVFTGTIAITGLFAVTALFYVFAGQMVGLFIRNETIIDYGTRFMRGMCLGLPFVITDFLGVGTYQACGKGHLSLIFAILRKVVLEIPLLYLLNYLKPLYGLAYAATISEVLLAVAAVLTIRGLFRKMERLQNGSQDLPGKSS